MDLYADVHYPRELIADHLVGGSVMQVRVFNLGKDPDDMHMGLLDGMTIIHRKEWITDELDCFKQYRSPEP